jgi:methionyl-tRNA synthetase
MPDTPNKFYLTTPIYYVNARPHIGHAYSTIAADVIARRHRLLGDDTFFLTGTDEHGQKVQRSAAAAGIPPQQFADEVSASFQNLWKRMGITNDDYIRTTDERHKRGVQHLWRVLEERGAIYLSSYTGQYCVSDEAFVDVPVGAPCPTCGRITETITEENYFFKLSEYQEKLINLIESGELHIQPETARNEVLSFVRGNLAHSDIKDGNVILSGARSAESKDLRFSAAGNPYIPGALKDLSISRTTFDWGIPVPPPKGVILTLSEEKGKNPRISPDAPPKPPEKHVVYVWLDALANYITAIGYGAEDRDDLTPEQKQAELAKFARHWPADIHLVGKEITRFHCVYWPALLMAAGIATPKSVVANGWLLFEESKMSKSRGNVVRTETILDAFGPLCPSCSPSPDLLSSRSEAEGSASPEAPRPPTEAKDGSSSGLVARGFSLGSPAVSTPKEAGALAPGLAAPTKAQQDLFAADVLRYFLLREIPFGQDGSFSFDALITRYNADLANGYGNLVSRTLTMLSKYFGAVIPSFYLVPGLDGPPRSCVSPPFLPHDSVERSARRVITDAETVIESSRFSSYLELCGTLIKDTDEALSRSAPWKELSSADETRDHRSLILCTAGESIRIITALLYPVMPYATASVWRQLGLGSIEEAARNGELKNLQWGGLKPGTKLGPLAPIFPRADKGLAQIMTDMENPTTPAAAEPAKPAADPSEPTAEALNAVNPTASAPAAAPGTSNLVPSTSTITIDDFAKIDLRVAEIVVAERIPKADKLLRLEVDLGPGFDPPRRQILAGIAEYYAPETLIGRKVVIVANLAPRKMRGLESNGMIVAASVGPSGAPVLVGFAEDVELGARLK